MIHRIRAPPDCPQRALPCLAWRAALPNSSAGYHPAPLTSPGAHDARGRHYAAAAAPPPPPPTASAVVGIAGMGTAAVSAAAIGSGSSSAAALQPDGQSAAGPVLALAWGRQLRLWHLVSPPGGGSSSGGGGGGGGSGGGGGGAAAGGGGNRFSETRRKMK